MELLTGMESRLENSNSVILYVIRFISVCPLLSRYSSCASNTCVLLPFVFRGSYPRTFNICNSVVFPALSRPRNRSLACLFKSPKDASVSQTVGGDKCQRSCNSSPSAFVFWKFPDSELTPVDNPHIGELFVRQEMDIKVGAEVVGSLDY